MKKAFDQTVRDLKREMNKKVLKIPGIEQKILDATSNEAWGPHGSLMADIAQATRNYHEYQTIMSVLWKRINDTGKNWRHVYKALTVLDYLVGHGSERVIDEIREHAYQISTLSDFQYIDSKGRDQGNNVRRKSQSLVALVNDKERIQEVRQKAFANKDKYRPTGGMHRPGSYSSPGREGYADRYDDDRYEGRYRDEDRDGYGRERDGGYRDDDRYGRGGDPYNRDGDRYGRDPEDRYSRESYRDDDYRGSRSSDNYQFGSRTRSFDRDRERSYEDDYRYSSRNGGGRADDHPQDEGRLERKLSEQDVSAPPNYEEAIGNARNHSQGERDGGTGAAPAPKETSPPVPKASSPPGSVSQYGSTAAAASAFPTDKEVDGFDEFDPRGSAPPAPPAPGNTSGMDLFDSLTDINPLALVPVTPESATSEADPPANSGFETNFVASSTASTPLNQPGEDPWGANPFKATPQDDFTAQPQNFTTSPFPPTTMGGGSGAPPQMTQPAEPISQFEFGDSLHGLTYTPLAVTNIQLPQTTPQVFPSQMPAPQPNGDILGNILPQSGPSGFVAQASQPVAPMSMQQSHPVAPVGLQPTYSQAALPDLQQSGLSAPASSQASLSVPNDQPWKTQPSNDKFKTKSTVWADTLNRGLVDLNISGPKTNPLADIGVDFDSLNRKEKRQEKASAAAATVTSTVTMGKAMGSGSGIGRVGASVLAAPPNPIMGGGTGMGMAGYGGGMNQPMGMGMGMNMGMGMSMMRPPVGMPPPGLGMPGAYNPMMGMGMGGYGSQQQYGGYR
ncbi:Clathrin interactor EPSIN 3 [Acorus gramineus]|uniref:Clathrin interactor EPSIN 3 n=1 Tax=Acorus gramineus TaxID=55184 RepID=A0AAV9ARR1_ACOGR|nr:Clathrin interactor EPSIN 3 [Acorus gramineus]